MKLSSFIKGYRAQAAASPILKMLEAIMELIVPLVVAKIIDVGIPSGDRMYVVYACLIIVGFGILGLVFSLSGQYFAAKAAVGFSKGMRYEMFKHIGKFSYSQLDTIGTATLITRMTSDSNQVQTGINLTLRLLLRSPFVVFGAMIAAFLIDVQSGYIFLAAVPVLSLVIFLIMFFSVPMYKKVQKNVDDVLLSTRENLTGARVLRAFCLEEKEIEAFDVKNEKLTNMQKRVGRISALLNPLTFAVINVAIICIIYVGGIKVYDGVLSQGEVVALYNYMSQILIELIKCANLIVSLNKAVASAHRIQAVFDVVPDERKGEKDFPENFDIEFKDVSLRYANGGDYAVTGVNFKAKSGETIGVIGGTGSGKTSLVNLLPRFYEATKGEVLIGGENVNDINFEQLRLSIGVVPQKAVLFKGTIRDNMCFGKKASDEEIEKALKVAQADEIVKLKGGLDFMVEQNGQNLSGGQKQRLTIARALVLNPKILILDDSASALDYRTDYKLRSALKELKGLTTFIVSQRTSSIMYADKIIVLDAGKVVGIGKHEKLLETCEVYRQIYNSQTGA